MADREAAQRLKRALRVAMTEKGIDDWITLSIKAKVSQTTIDNWIYARTVPRSKELRRVGDYLRPYSSPAELEAAYAGIEPPEPPVVDVLKEMLPDLRELIVLMRAQADQALLEEVRSALAARRRRLVEPGVESSSSNGDGNDRGQGQ